ncbi:MAG: tetratricopeptide repeat protein [Nannocystaceae bacterium]
MAALLDEFDRQERRTRQSRLLGLAGGVFALGAAALGARRPRRPAGPGRLCAARGAAIDDLWGPAARAEITRAFVATERPAAPSILAKTLPWLDHWSDRWEAASTEACLADEVEGTLDAELRARAVDCLDEARGDFEALLVELRHADAGTLYRATLAAIELPPVDVCLDPAVLRARPAAGLAYRSERRALRPLFARARSLRAAGRYDESVTIGREALAAARATAAPTLVALAELVVASSEAKTGDYAAAEASNRRALEAARATHDAELASIAMVDLVWIVGDRGNRFAEGKVWAEAAKSMLSVRAGNPEGARVALDANLGQVYHAEGDRETAATIHERAVAGWTAIYGPDHPSVALALNNLANTRGAMGQQEEALALHQRALAIRIATYGELHPAVASSLANIALVKVATGAALEALDLDVRALAIREASLPPDHPDVLESLNNLGARNKQLGRVDRAAELYERALAILERDPTREPKLRATLLYNLGLIYEGRHDHDRALAVLERSLSTFEAILGPDHATVAYPLCSLITVHIARGEAAEALRVGARCQALREATLGKDNPQVAVAMAMEAVAHRKLGHAAEALRLADEALALVTAKVGPEDKARGRFLVEYGECLLASRRARDAVLAIEEGKKLHLKGTPPPGEIADFDYALARARWDAGDRGGALTLAHGARSVIVATPNASTTTLAEIDGWLASHRI